MVPGLGNSVGLPIITPTEPIAWDRGAFSRLIPGSDLLIGDHSMTRRIVLAALLGVAVALPSYAADEKSPLEGKWTVTSLTRDGKVDKSLEGAVREHAGDKYSVTPATGSTAPKAEGTATIDPTKKTIDMKPSAGRYKDKVLKGIFKIEGDTLTVAFSSDPDKDRPTAFESKDGSGIVIAVHTRVK